MKIRSGAGHIHLPTVVGKGYGTFWNFKGRYRVVKGSRRSKKSKTMALWSIVSLMQYPESNLLVVRKTFRTLKDSCFTELKWAISRLGVEEHWIVKESPLEMTYKPTGQKIYFRGLDDPLKVTSIAVEIGVLSWMWIEEAYEITSEADFDTLVESMYGACPDGLFKQVTLTFNPWSERHWLKERFFDKSDPDVLAMTTNYLCNEWLSEADRLEFEKMRVGNPQRYRVAGLGDWGIAEGLVYENWEERSFDIDELRTHSELRAVFGLDFGFAHDPAALFCGLYDQKGKTLWVFDEMYAPALLNDALYDKISAMGYSKERIIADCASSKDIADLRGKGLYRIEASAKGKGSVIHGIRFIQELHIIVHPRCVNFKTELSLYVWAKDKFGKPTGDPIDTDNHLLDAMRYALEPYDTENRKVRTVNRARLLGGR